MTPTVERTQTTRSKSFLAFQIHEGKRAKYDTPTITGVTKLPDATILRATGWRFPIIHWWRHVTSSRTRDGVQGVLNKYGSKDRSDGARGTEEAGLRREPPPRASRPGYRRRANGKGDGCGNQGLTPRTEEICAGVSGARRGRRSARNRQAQSTGIFSEQGLLRRHASISRFSPSTTTRKPWSMLFRVACATNWCG